MMWETTADIVQGRGATILLGTEVKRIHWAQGRINSIEIGMNQEKKIIHGSDFISSMPIRELVQKLDPLVPVDVLRAAEGLHYRDFITVALIINRRDLFPDNWLYIHDPGVRLGRIQNFKNWSPFMVADASKTCLGLEYFCFEGDGLWTMSDGEVVELGKKELIALQLATSAEIEEGIVVRVPKAYPVYDIGYKESLRIVREFLGQFNNLQLVGRNGMHKYNNQDHSMLTAMLAVDNILGASHNLWEVNADPEYHEEITEPGARDAGDFARLASTQPGVPDRKISPPPG